MMIKRVNTSTMSPALFEALVEAWVSVIVREYDARYPVTPSSNTSVTMTPPSPPSSSQAA